MHDCFTKKFKLKYKTYFFGKFILMFILPFIAFNGWFFNYSSVWQLKLFCVFILLYLQFNIQIVPLCNIVV